MTTPPSEQPVKTTKELVEELERRSVVTATQCALGLPTRESFGVLEDVRAALLARIEALERVRTCAREAFDPESKPGEMERLWVALKDYDTTPTPLPLSEGA